MAFARNRYRTGRQGGKVGGGSFSQGVLGLDPNLTLLSSNYTSTQAACDALLAMTHWYDELDAGSATATGAEGSNSLTIASGSLFTDGVLQPGDIWSPDGTRWYNISAIPDDTTITLMSELGAAVSGAAVRIARPIRRTLIIDTDNHDSLHLDDGTIRPLYLDVRDVTPHAFVGGLETTFTCEAPSDGTISLYNLIQLANTTAWATGSRASASTFATVEWNENYCRNYSNGTDVIYPDQGCFGNITLNHGYYRAQQDHIIPSFGVTGGQGKIILNDTTVHQVCADGALFPVALVTRGFRYAPDECNRCHFIVDHTAKDPDNPAGASVILQGDYANNTNTTVINDSTFSFMGADESRMQLIGAYQSGLTGTVDVTLNTCTIDASEVSGGAVTIVEAQAWVGGSLTMNGCTKTNTVDGGGGTFTITNNP